jgi:hypothetical protein
MPSTRWIWRAIAVWGLAGLPASTYGAEPAIVVRERYCCADSFNATAVAKRIRSDVPGVGVLRLTVVQSQPYEEGGFASGTHTPWNWYRKLVLAFYSKIHPKAYVVESHTGVSVVLWNPQTGGYESGRVKGDDLLHLSSGPEIVHLGPGLLNDASVLRVWVWVKGRLDRQRALELLSETKAHMRVSSVEVVAGSSPFFWDSGGFPLWVPAFGALGKRGIESAQPSVVFQCSWTARDKGPNCYESHGQIGK